MTGRFSQLAQFKVFHLVKFMITDADILESVEVLKANGVKAPYEILLSSEEAHDFMANADARILVPDGFTKFFPNGELGKHSANLGDIKIFKPY